MTLVADEFLYKYNLWVNYNKENGYDLELRYKNNILLLKEFTNKFTLDFIKNMDIDDYVVGKKDGESFCWWVEDTLFDLGDIRGGRLTASQRFGLYYSKSENKYIYSNVDGNKSKFGNSVEEVFDNIKKQLIELLQAIDSHNVDSLIENKINPLFKNKIMYLYDFENQIPIYSLSDLTKILTQLDIRFSSKDDRVVLRDKLFNFYKNIRSAGMTPWHFMVFIYSDFGYRSVLRSTPNISKYSKEEISNIKIEDVTNFKDLLKKGCSKKGLVKETYDSFVSKKITGKEGESIVKSFLEYYRSELNIKPGSSIDCACEYDDAKHYDFKYETSDGSEVFIEVKSSKINHKDDILFQMSLGEYSFMKSHINSYFVFYLDDVYNAKIIKRISAETILKVIKPVKFAVEIEEVKSNSIVGDNNEVE